MARKITKRNVWDLEGCENAIEYGMGGYGGAGVLGGFLVSRAFKWGVVPSGAAMLVGLGAGAVLGGLVMRKAVFECAHQAAGN